MRWMVLVVALSACNDGSGSTPSGACASGEFWTGGDEESPLMRPGGDCIECHDSGEGPNLSAAGTVMGAYDDVDDCNGVQGVTVRITDANGDVHELTTNAAGNFYTNESIPTPFTAEVEKDGAVSPMLTSQVDTNCASCHTAEGANGAPGRIVAP